MNSKKNKFSIATLAYNLVSMYRVKDVAEVCHQCEKSQGLNVAVPLKCTSSKCDKIYCSKCLWNRYAQRLINCISSENWKCPFCNGSCNCQQCLEKRKIFDYSCEDIPGYTEALDSFYPFQTLGPPNNPCPSDFKPVFQAYAPKKRKFAFIPSPIKESAKIPSNESLQIVSNGNNRNTNSKSEFTENKLISGIPSDKIVDSSQNSSQLNRNVSIKSEEKEKVISQTESEQLIWKDSYGHHEVDHKATILVRNLNYTCSSEDLGELFKSCGSIEQITIPVDKGTNKLRGYGFVKFSKREYAEEAMRRFNKYNLKDRIIELEWSVDKSSRRNSDLLNRAPNSVCFKCGKDGHYSRSCPHQDSGQQNSYPSMDVEKDHRIPEYDMYERDSRKDREGKRELRGYICFKCGKEGHVASDCNEREDIGPGFKGVICFKCGVGGHLANKCDKRIKGCFLCGKDGHIASECTEPDVSSRDKLMQDERIKSTSIPHDIQSWESTQKYRRTSSPEGELRNPLSDWDEGDKERKQRWESTSYRSNNYERFNSNLYDLRINVNRDPRYIGTNTSETVDSSTRYLDTSNSRVEHSRLDERYQNGFTSSSSRSYEEISVPSNYNHYMTKGTPNVPILYYQNEPTRSSTPPSVHIPQHPSNILPRVSQNSSPQAQIDINQYSSFGNLSQSSNTQSTIQSNDLQERKKKFKSHWSTVVINRLSKYFKSGQIISKEHFKLLSRKIIHSLLEQEHPRYIIDTDSEKKIKKFIDSSFQQYQQHKQNSVFLAQWLKVKDSPK